MGSEINLSIGESYKELLSKIIKFYKDNHDPKMTASKYLRQHIVKDYINLFGKYSVELNGAKAICVSEKDAAFLKERIMDLQNNSINVDELLFEALCKQVGGYFVKDIKQHVNDRE
jgi:hypothetical protein